MQVRSLGKVARKKSGTQVRHGSFIKFSESQARETVKSKDLIGPLHFGCEKMETALKTLEARGVTRRPLAMQGGNLDFLSLQCHRQLHNSYSVTAGNSFSVVEAVVKEREHRSLDQGMEGMGQSCFPSSLDNSLML